MAIIPLMSVRTLGADVVGLGAAAHRVPAATGRDFALRSDDGRLGRGRVGGRTEFGGEIFLAGLDGSCAYRSSRLNGRFGGVFAGEVMMEIGAVAKKTQIDLILLYYKHKLENLR